MHRRGGTMTNTDMLGAVADGGAAMEQAVAIFMLHPENFAASIAAGYENPLAGYVAGRGGVLGEASGATVGSVFAVFEPTGLAAMWDEGIAVRGAAGAAQQYWTQAADFGRKYLAGVQGLDRLAALGEKVIAATPTAGLPLFAGWREMPLADDVAARALQVMFVLRELRAGVHFNALTISGITPVEAHMLNKGHDYTTMFGWPEPFADGADKADRYAEIEQATNRRMTEVFTAALDPAEVEEIARLGAEALSALKANVPS
ncbi:evbL [Mycobacterium syngnathidarum]|uniref:EvbL n=2 Tax=Mycobacterium syngnathidarum TaxID=1908205 RepID=A0A1Q9W283_9MYCO|nr:evbL [Mycobacterium syngnathidarum]OLT85658.1 evbL [Mycobacterium syngnathidarum]